MASQTFRMEANDRTSVTQNDEYKGGGNRIPPLRVAFRNPETIVKRRELSTKLSKSTSLFQKALESLEDDFVPPSETDVLVRAVTYCAKSTPRRRFKEMWDMYRRNINPASARVVARNWGDRHNLVEQYDYVYRHKGVWQHAKRVPRADIRRTNHYPVGFNIFCYERFNVYAEGVSKRQCADNWKKAMIDEYGFPEEGGAFWSTREARRLFENSVMGYSSVSKNRV